MNACDLFTNRDTSHNRTLNIFRSISRANKQNAQYKYNPQVACKRDDDVGSSQLLKEAATAFIYQRRIDNNCTLNDS